MNGEFVDRMAANIQRPLQFGERIVTPQGWQEVHERPDLAPAVLQVATLTGFLDYVRANRDELDLAKVVVHVLDHARVALRGPIRIIDQNTRHEYVQAAFEQLFGKSFSFGVFVDAETFVISLQTLFEKTTQRDDLHKLIAGIKENSVKTTFDDGAAQSVNVAAGVTLVGEVKVPNPVALKPFRTFREVEQPESLFVLRLQPAAEGQPKPRVALFEADGGAWKRTAIERVAEFLKAKLDPGIAVIA